MRKTKLCISHADITSETLREEISNHTHSRVGIRIALLQGVLRNEPITEISDRHSISRFEIYKLVNRVNQKGISGIKDGIHSGRKRKLTSEQETELKIAVLKSPKEKKYSQARWDGPLVSKYVKDEYDVEISIRQAQRILKRMGLTLQRPRKKFIQGDEKEQQEFKEKLKKK